MEVFSPSVSEKDTFGLSSFSPDLYAGCIEPVQSFFVLVIRECYGIVFFSVMLFFLRGVFSWIFIYFRSRNDRFFIFAVITWPEVLYNLFSQFHHIVVSFLFRHLLQVHILSMKGERSKRA